MQDVDDKKSGLRITLFASDGTDADLDMKHVEINSATHPNVTHMLSTENHFLLCGSQKMLVSQKSRKKKTLTFLNHHRIIAIDKETIWSVYNNNLYAFDYDGITMAREKLEDDFLSFNASFCFSSSIYICSDNGLLRYNMQDKEIKKISGVYEYMDASITGDIMLYGGSKCYISEAGENLSSKLAFHYDEENTIQMKWMDTAASPYIVVLEREHVFYRSHLNDCECYTKHRSPPMTEFVALATGAEWAACLQSNNVVQVRDYDLQLKYIIASGEALNSTFMIGESYNSLCLINGFKATVMSATPLNPHYTWLDDLNKWSLGISSMGACNSVNVSVVKEKLIECIPIWINSSPSLDSCRDFKKICDTSVEVLHKFIAEMDNHILSHEHSTSRDFWKQMFEIISYITNGGIPDSTRKMLIKKKNVYAIAECCYVFGAGIIGDSASLVTWLILNQNMPIFREILYDLINCEKYGEVIVDIVTATCATASQEMIQEGNNPFFLLSCSDIVKSCKRGHTSEWIKIFQSCISEGVTIHMQNIWDNISEIVVFGPSLHNMLKCIFMTCNGIKSNQPYMLTMAPTIRMAMLKCVYDTIAVKYKQIPEKNIYQTLKLFDFTMMKVETRGFTKSKILGTTTNDCGIYISTDSGVFSVPYVGLRNVNKIITPLTASCIASTNGRLALSCYVEDEGNYLMVYNTDNDALLFRWKTKNRIVYLDFMENVLFTIEENERVFVYNHETGRIEDILRVPVSRRRRDRASLSMPHGLLAESSDEEEGVRVAPDVSPAVAPAVTPAAEQNRQSGESMPLPPPESPPPPPPPPDSPPRNLSHFHQWKFNVLRNTSKVTKVANYIVENNRGKCIVWKKRGLTFSSKCKEGGEHSWITLFIPGPNSLFGDTYINVSKWGNIEIVCSNGRPRRYVSKRHELVTCAVQWSSNYIVTGSANGTLSLFNMQKMKETEFIVLPKSTTIVHLNMDGPHLYVSTNRGVFLVTIDVWRQMKMLDTLTSLFNSSEVWKKRIVTFPFEFTNVVKSERFLKFVELCTREKVSSAFRSTPVVETIMNHSQSSSKLATVCLHRLIKDKPKESAFKCTICQSSTVSLENHLDLILPCLHRFHHTCLKGLVDAQPTLNEFTQRNWALESTLKCPICRIEFTKDQIKRDMVSTNLCIYESDFEDNEDE